MGDGDTITHLYRAHAGRVLALLIARLNDFQLAEDALQDAWLEATKRWSTEGIPNAPDAWLLTVARRRAIDQLRRIGTRESSQEELKFAYQLEAEWSSDELLAEEAIPDERLRLIFTCCHPALRSEHQIALTLRTLCGLSTEEIARAFLLPATTMAQRIVRAKRKIRDAKIPYRVPEGEQLGERLEAVRSVVYLTFNEGYVAHTGDMLIRDELCTEAIRLARLLNEQVSDPENAGLLALLMLHHSRCAARIDDEQNYVPLDQQNRALWDDDQAQQGKALLMNALGHRRPGPYQIQAAISAVHSDSKQNGHTDWAQISGLYQALLDQQDTPVVRLNYALAVANTESPTAGLTLIECLATVLDSYQPFHAARADLLRRTARFGEACKAYDRAISLTTNALEKPYLMQQRQICILDGNLNDQNK